MGNTSDPHGEGRHEWLADEPVPTRFQRESLVLMAQRMQLGLALYPLIWAELTLIDGQAWRHTGFAWAHGLTLALISVTRFVYHRHLLKHMPEDVTRTRRVFCGLSLAHNLYWGLLCARIFGIGAHDTLSWMMLVATVGITAGGTVITASDPVLPRIYAFATLGPTALVLLPQGGWTNISITLSRTDALTRIANRLSFEENLHAAWRLASRRRESLAVAMIDLDHFKRINDEFGHPFGDQCLAEAAKAISGQAQRPGDLIARYGGEEFVMLMPLTSEEGAALVAEQILQRVCQTRVGDQAVALSCSVGVASCVPQPGSMPQTLVQQADQALYLAKSRGRARVETQGALLASASELHAASP
jgi:diguanylate cyclase (GGDEF)-like protein